MNLPLWIELPLYIFCAVVAFGCGVMVVVKIAMYFFK